VGTHLYASSFLILSPELTLRRESCDPGPAAGLSVCLCFPAQELIPSLRKLDRLLEAAGKLWCRGSSWTDCPLEAAKFHFPDWKTDFQENLFLMFCSRIQKKTQLQIWTWEFLRAILVLGGGWLAHSQMACILLLAWPGQPWTPSCWAQRGSPLNSCWVPPSRLSKIFWCHFVTDLDSNPSPATSLLTLWLPASYLAFLSLFPYR
jgi:hypothetical protein